MIKQLFLIITFVAATATSQHTITSQSSLFDDKTRAYAIPTLYQTPKGEVALSWTEKDSQGMVYFYWALSKDNGVTFSEKKLIYSAPGIGNSRLMRPKLLFKKDGTMIAVFSNRSDVPAEKPEERPKREIQILYTASTDQGNTWLQPKQVDSDPTKGLVRGFFDAVILPNDEIAITYLKDVLGSTKHEERNLRLVLSKNGVFQPERIIDDVVCDCCSISMLVNTKGVLSIYYRDNQDDIRDISVMTSSDNALTFSAPKNLYKDNWLIKGCPHTGAISSQFDKTNLIAWYSGGTNQPGVRLTNQEGKLLCVASDPTAKNAYVSSSASKAVFLWEQTKKESEATFSQIAFRTISADKASDINWLGDSINGTNASGLVLGNQLIVAYEVKQESKLNGIRISTTAL